MSKNRSRKDNRSARTGKNRTTQAKKPEQPDPPETWHVPRFGDVPVVVDPATGYRGYDPAWPTKLPSGAIRGDIRKQVYCCDTPNFYYLDRARTCVQCGDDFTFWAREQKYWYETLQFRLDSDAIRCPACRKARRTKKAIRQRLANASDHAKSDDPIELIEYASSLVDFIEATGDGDPTKAVAAARKARRLQRDWAEPLYWEARAHQQAGRADKAWPTYQSFLAEGAGGKAARRLRKDTVRRLAADR